jgi:hypothetical protein
MKNMKSILAGLLGGCALALVAGGCSTISADVKQNIAAPNFPPTSPATVQILSAPPLGSYARVGQINLTVEGEPGKAAIQERFRREASKLGANAVIVVSDQIVVLSTYISGPWWGREASPITGRLIVGEAIRLAETPSSR